MSKPYVGSDPNELKVLVSSDPNLDSETILASTKCVHTAISNLKAASGIDPDAPSDFGIWPSPLEEGKFLTNDGASVSWGDVPIPPTDLSPLENSIEETNTNLENLQDKVDKHLAVPPYQVWERFGYRNVITSGRQVEGFPKYIASIEELPIHHTNLDYRSNMGYISQESVSYSTAYTVTRMFRNALGFEANYWASNNNADKSLVVPYYFEYTFDEPQRIIGLWMMPPARGNTYSIKSWEFQACTSDKPITFEKVYEEIDEPGQYGSNTSNPNMGRYYWFPSNTKAYKKYRFVVKDIYGSEGDIVVMKFFTHPVVGAGPRDIALYGSPEEPFHACIAYGNNADRDCHLEESVLLDVRKQLCEDSRNYLYLVGPDPETEELPEGLEPEKCKEFTDKYGAKFWIYSSVRPLNWGSIGDVERTCLAWLQADGSVRAEQATTSATADANRSLIRYNIAYRKVLIDQEDGFRGSPQSFNYTADGEGIYVNPQTKTDVSGSLLGVLEGYEHTVEFDAKWTDEDITTNAQYEMFDMGRSGAKGWILAYWPVRRCIVIYQNGNWSYQIPYKMDSNWHTWSVSLRKDTMYVHVDGKCIGHWIELNDSKSGVTAWCLGQLYASSTHSFRGKMTNLRITYGKCLHQAEDYEVFPTFEHDLVYDKALWYDSTEGIVKEYRHQDHKWHPIPMLPIGHVDTRRLANLLSDQRAGQTGGESVGHLYPFDPNGWVSVNEYNAPRSSYALFNFKQGGSEAWISKNNTTTTESSCQFKLRKPQSFERFMMIFPREDDYRIVPHCFQFLGSNTGNDEDWTVLIDRSKFVDDGGACGNYGIADDHRIMGWKEFKIEDETPYLYYKIFYPIRVEDPGVPKSKDYVGYGYSCHLLELTLRDASPDIVDARSYAIGTTWSYGPFSLGGVGKDVQIPVPYGNVPYDFEGYTTTQLDKHVKTRKFHYCYAENTGPNGEFTFQYPESIRLISASSYLDFYVNGKWNAPDIDEASQYANYWIVCRRRY